MLGLLGTVLGLIDSFSLINIGQAGVDNIEVTGGISEALVSTAAGLIVAITALLFSNYFSENQEVWAEIKNFSQLKKILEKK